LVAQVQHTAGNQAASRLVQRMLAATSQTAPIQRCVNCLNPLCVAGEVCGNRQNKYDIGQHGAKKREQKRLSQKFKIPVTGTGFESEHTVGFEPLNQTSGDQRGGTARAKNLENTAYAYQEVKDYHREHIGTGTTNDRDDSGFNSKEYRDSQRHLIESGNVSASVQLNQLGYAFNPQFQSNSGTTQSQAATNSFNVMVGGMQQVTYAQGGNNTATNVTDTQRAEMILSRIAAQTGKWPTPDEIYAVYKQLGIW
jgi:hypothetical protein